MRLLFLGDIFGRAGRLAVEGLAAEIRRDERVDVIVANGENVAGGIGITPKDAQALLAHVDLLTGGNHIWSKSEIVPLLEDPNGRILRPLNYPPGAPGRGFAIVERDGFRLGVVNLEGRIFMKPLDDPFRAADEAVEKLRGEGVRMILVDLHAEATSEKWAMGRYLDGRVSAVIGSHSHVQTADERLLPNGTAFLTDAGMCGPRDSIIGMKVEGALKRMLSQRPAALKPAETDVWLHGAIVEIDDDSGRARSIARLQRACALE